MNKPKHTLFDFKFFDKLTREEKQDKLFRMMKMRVDCIRDMQLSVYENGVKETISQTHFYMEGLFLDCYALIYGMESLKKHVDSLIDIGENNETRTIN